MDVCDDGMQGIGLAVDFDDTAFDESFTLAPAHNIVRTNVEHVWACVRAGTINRKTLAGQLVNKKPCVTAAISASLNVYRTIQFFRGHDIS
jgi:hypothetical protein